MVDTIYELYHKRRQDFPSLAEFIIAERELKNGVYKIDKLYFDYDNSWDKAYCIGCQFSIPVEVLKLTGKYQCKYEDFKKLQEIKI